MIGHRVWFFDENRRVYRRDAKGKAVGCPIWREHWRPAVVCGETPRYFLVGHSLDSNVTLANCLAKIPKKGVPPKDVLFDEAEIDRRAWVKRHSILLANKLRTIECAETLRKVADLIGFEAN
jgi:hypothetical protein